MYCCFDPSYIPKSGKKTYDKGHYWSGKDQQIKAGLEIGCLALVNSEDHTAYIMDAVQTPTQRMGKLMDHYVSTVNNNIKRILGYTSYIAADGYFMKKNVYRTDAYLGPSCDYLYEAGCQLEVPVYRPPEKGPRQKTNQRGQSEREAYR